MTTPFDRADEVITALGDEATLAETEFALRDFPDRVVRVALAKRAAAGGGGGLDVLADPGVAWQPDHVYAEGDLFANTIEGELRVFEITTAGTSGSGALLDYGIPSLLPNGEWGTNSEIFNYRGIVGQLSWEITPALVETLTLETTSGDGRELVYRSTAAPGDSEQLFGLDATVDDVAVAVFESRTDGDADWNLDLNAGAGFRYNITEDGVIVAGSGKTQMTTDGFRVTSTGAGGDFLINFDPFFISVTGLPTADPGVGHAGELWIDEAAGRVLKVSAG